MLCERKHGLKIAAQKQNWSGALFSSWFSAIICERLKTDHTGCYKTAQSLHLAVIDWALQAYGPDYSMHVVIGLSVRVENTLLARAVIFSVAFGGTTVTCQVSFTGKFNSRRILCEVIMLQITISYEAGILSCGWQVTLRFFFSKTKSIKKQIVNQGLADDDSSSPIRRAQGWINYQFAELAERAYELDVEQATWQVICPWSPPWGSRDDWKYFTFSTVIGSR